MLDRVLVAIDLGVYPPEVKPSLVKVLVDVDCSQVHPDSVSTELQVVFPQVGLHVGGASLFYRQLRHIKPLVLAELFFNLVGKCLVSDSLGMVVLGVLGRYFGCFVVVFYSLFEQILREVSVAPIEVNRRISNCIQ